MQFFWGGASYASRRALQEVNPNNCLISYSSEIDPPENFNGNLTIDSGGYTITKKHAGYPTHDDDYLDYIEALDADYFMCRDYPVFLKKELRHEDTRSLIRGSIEVEIRLLKRWSLRDHDAQPVVVIQGENPNDYRWHASELSRQGIPDDGYLTDRVAIGNLAYKDTDTKLEIIRAVRDEIDPEKEIHGLAVNLNDLENRPILLDLIDACDSNKWDYSSGSPSRWEGKRDYLNEKRVRFWTLYHSYNDTKKQQQIKDTPPVNRVSSD